MQVVPIVPLIFSFQSYDDIMIRGVERLFMRRIFCAAHPRERPHIWDHVPALNAVMTTRRP
jgi:hypothetical protein